jgi:hypothetical protein
MIVCDEVAKYRKRRGKRKPFVVEYFMPRQWSCMSYPESGWDQYRRYETKEKAVQAVEDLKRSHASIRWNFRVREQ